MKKITKILPLAMALMMAGSAFAADTSNSGTADFKIEVPEFINITKLEDVVEESTASFDAKYTTLSIAPAIHTGFNVVTNASKKDLYLYGTCQSADGEQVALFGTAGALKLVFANTTEGARPSSDAVSDLVAGNANAASNANAIVFDLTPNISDASIKATLASGKVTYELKNGSYDFSYTLGEAALDGTFSTHDTAGDYKAKLLLTDTVTP